jgi:uncharacterized protein YndB with AHSA1/START domain/DNA-binding transcriptional ArsR family regulator
MRGGIVALLLGSILFVWAGGGPAKISIDHSDIHRDAVAGPASWGNGQTLGALCQRLDMTRQAVAKHLSILEEANLVSWKRQGREKLHFIQSGSDLWNRRPLDRQVRARPVVGTRRPQEETGKRRQMSSKFVHVICIRTTPEKLWDALTKPEFMRQYWYNAGAECDWKRGSSWKLMMPDGGVADAGEVLETDPPNRLVKAFSETTEWPRSWITGGTKFVDVTYTSTTATLRSDVVNQVKLEKDAIGSILFESR